MIQVDTLCHKIPNFIAKAKRAGVTRIFIGLENINPDNLLAAKKRQNKITEYRKMLLAWKAVGIWTYAGYILGFPQRHAGIDPPRHRDHQEGTAARHPRILRPDAAAGLRGPQGAVDKGVAMDPDLNKYDLEHVVTAHPKMSKAEWEKLYRDAWKLYYTPEHIETILRRARRSGSTSYRLMLIILWFSARSRSRGCIRCKAASSG